MEILSRKYQILNHFPTGFVPDPEYLHLNKMHESLHIILELVLNTGVSYFLKCNMINNILSEIFLKLSFPQKLLSSI